MPGFRKKAKKRTPLGCFGRFGQKVTPHSFQTTNGGVTPQWDYPWAGTSTFYSCRSVQQIALFACNVIRRTTGFFRRIVNTGNVFGRSNRQCLLALKRGTSQAGTFVPSPIHQTPACADHFGDDQSGSRRSHHSEWVLYLGLPSVGAAGPLPSKRCGIREPLSFFSPSESLLSCVYNIQ